jgi:ABC-type transport system substrate-binding protein
MRGVLKWGLAAGLIAMSMGAAAAKDTATIGQTLETARPRPDGGRRRPDPLHHLRQSLYEGLVRVLEDGSVTPVCWRKSWTISDDQKVYTFKLRQGVKFP